MSSLRPLLLGFLAALAATERLLPDRHGCAHGPRQQPVR